MIGNEQPHGLFESIYIRKLGQRLGVGRVGDSCQD